MEEEINMDYQPPVDQLLTLGEPEGLVNSDKWLDYLAYGLTQEHIPELIRMAADEELNQADQESLEVWAPIHAIRALGQLRAEAAIEPLIQLMDTQQDDEWMQEDLPRVFGLIGPAAIPVLAAALADTARDVYRRAYTANALLEIAEKHPESSAECISIIVRQLERSDEVNPELNGFLVSDLADLKDTTLLPVIEQAYKNNKVDELIINFEDVQAEMGLIERKMPTFSPDIFLPKPAPSFTTGNTSYPNQHIAPPIKFSGKKVGGKKKAKKGKKR